VNIGQLCDPHAVVPRIEPVDEYVVLRHAGRNQFTHSTQL